jgi:hypothetical protein
MDHFLIQGIDLGKVCDIFIPQKRLRGLEYLHNYIVETLIQNHILMIQTGLHQASADELGDGRIVDGLGSWLNFFDGSDIVFDPTFLAQYIVFGNDGIFVNGMR